MTLKQKLESLRKEIENKIIRGEFTTKEADVDPAPSYIGRIKIDVDGLNFEMSISNGKGFVCLTEREIELHLSGVENLKELYKAWEKNLNRDEQIELLYSKIRKLENEKGNL